MKALQLKEGIYWVGAIDWKLRDFHGYVTQRGSTYNAYLIIDEKITLIDTVKQYCVGEMMERIRSVIDPAKIDYIVCNHVEMDHSGSLPAVMALAPGATILTSPNGEKGLAKHYDTQSWKIKSHQSGETVSLGKRSLVFTLAPMVHWPDSMLSYMPEEKILYSNDAFGQHIASSERFSDQLPHGLVIEETAKYYANIVLPYGAQVQKLLEQASALDIDMIAPSHGVIFRRNIPEITRLYGKWSKNESDEKALVVYDTMWGATEKMAYALCDMFEDRAIAYSLLNLSRDHISDVMTVLLDSKYVCVGSPTLNNQTLPTVAAFLTYMKGLAPKGRIGLAFGSYGWSGQSIKHIEDTLESCGFVVPVKGLKINYVPSVKDIEQLREKAESALSTTKEKTE
jgi:flavorubredoxin